MMKTIIIPLKIHVHRNYCMFEIPSEKPVQNSQFWNTQNSKTSKSEISETWREKRLFMQDIIIQEGLFYKFNIIIKKVVHAIKIKALLLILL